MKVFKVVLFLLICILGTWLSLTLGDLITSKKAEEKPITIILREIN